MKKFDVGHGTHPGLKRACNEDRYLVAPDIGLFLVADGMGGHEAGDVASDIVVREVTKGVRRGALLVEAIAAAHRSVRSAAARGEGAWDMGSTVVALRLEGLRYEVAWVGDSRAYLWNGALHQITRDHSYVQLLLDAGLIGKGEVATHPYRNVITQALGGSGKIEVKVDRIVGELSEGDSLLLCSDGLSGEVSEDMIAAILAETRRNQAKVDRLIRAALAAGGNDNVTAILVSAI